MALASKTFHNHLVYYDDTYPHRWLDVIGANVVKHVFDGVNYSADLYTVTAVNSSTITGVESTNGGQMVFTADSSENDGVQAQLLGEAFYLDGSKYPCYVGARFKANDVDQVDAFIGLGLQDTSHLAGADTDIGFRTDDESTALLFVLEKDTNETTVSVATLSDDTYVTVEFYYDGDEVTYYVDGSEIGSVATSATNMPDDEHMAPILAMLTGEGVANTMTVDWARFFQIYE